MVDECERLKSAARDFDLEADDDFVDPKALSAVIDLLQGKLCKVLHQARRRGDHQLARLTPTSWVARTCGLSRTAAADRLCVGKHLSSLPAVADALAKGEIGFQSTSAICHLRDQLREKWDPANESETVEFARGFSVEDFRALCQHARHAADPDGFEKDSEDDYERRWLEVNPMLDGMHAIDGVLDPATGAAFRTALESLAQWRGEGDTRNHGQRMADALGELLDHHMNEGRLPRQNGVRPHVTLTTTLEGLKGEVGFPAAELEGGVLIGGKTVERLACDCTMSRVLLADSMVIDVGRATRTIAPATRRALQKRDRHCRWPGCDRPIGWTNPHHIEFWSRGGPTNLTNLVSLCHYHHRQVHEGGWQVVKAGNEFRFHPPERLRTAFARGPDLGVAA
ncbi:MAG: DUF222 domain-containing protein [Chloroflexi bacterium]|nr:MAG: DUF222 domain-containing protein [Chloroflexota bacterium]